MLRVAAKLMPIVLLFLPRAQAVVFSSPESGLAEILEVERSLTFPGWRQLAERTRELYNVGLYTRRPTLVPRYLKQRLARECCGLRAWKAKKHDRHELGGNAKHRCALVCLASVVFGKSVWGSI